MTKKFWKPAIECARLSSNIYLEFSKLHDVKICLSSWWQQPLENTPNLTLNIIKEGKPRAVDSMLSFRQNDMLSASKRLIFHKQNKTN